ncbi:DUF3616 domain-containing protein [Saccharopolyspora rhizosphaerae]|uniref:DUF3616 domain-containing protein n=1 Tax=Saccharopolyspora rhizosphaerae TaxID=2492662 RepID=UPI002278BCE0|nr:DUF3616 domain-containing protein [Saccharopolyspora rhizosphaerae]
MVRRDDLHSELDLSHGEGEDHAGGLAVLPSGDLLVVQDSTAAHRLEGPGTVLADVLHLGRRPFRHANGAVAAARGAWRSDRPEGPSSPTARTRD